MPPAVVVVVERGTPRKWYSQTINNGDFSKTVSMEVYPTHPLTHHVHCTAQWRIGRAIVSEFFQRVLEDDERKACSPPLQTIMKLVFFFFLSHSCPVSTQYATRSLPFIWDAKEWADGLPVRRCILYRPREQEMVRAFAH
jgi:hypothetical protein